jgi:hypothetical protein
MSILYEKGREFWKKNPKNKIWSKIYEIFDLNEAYVNFVDE